MSSVQRRLLGCNAQKLFSAHDILAEQRERNFLALENVVEQCWVTIDDVHVRVRETTQRLAVILRQALKARRVVDGVQASTIFEFELDNVIATLGCVSLDAFQQDHVAIPSLCSSSVPYVLVLAWRMSFGNFAVSICSLQIHTSSAVSSK